MKSLMSINVDFLVDTDIEHAIIEAKEKANIWNVSYVTFNFNDTHCSIGKNANVEDAVKQFHDRDKKYKQVISA